MPSTNVEVRRTTGKASQARWRSNPDNLVKARTRKRQSARQRKAADPVGYRDKEWGHQIWTMYRMRPAQYFEKLKLQGGVCKYCKTDKPGTRWNRFCVDHDHRKPRGEGNRSLLCRRCNVMISLADDRPEILRAAADDLESYF